MNTKFKPLVATPVYNAEDTIIRLYYSIRNYPVTWLIYNDGSTDETIDKIFWMLSQDRVADICYFTQDNHGLTYGRNILCQRFLTDFPDFSHLIFIDADDYFNPGWFDRIYSWYVRVVDMYPDAKTPYLCFKYWNEGKVQDECQIYTKLNTNRKDHAQLCQYSGGGVDLLHVIPREYLIEVKNYDGNYYHVIEDEKWTSDLYNFLAYTDYPASFISDPVATIGGHEGSMGDTYYNNVVTKYAKGQIDEILMYMDKYCDNGADWTRVPAHRYRWMCKCLCRMIKNGTLVESGKKWDEFHHDKLTESYRYLDTLGD